MRRRGRARGIEAVVHGEMEGLRTELQALAAQHEHTEHEHWERTLRGVELTKALDRIADALDGLGMHLQLDRRERQAHAMSVEFLLRELVITLAEPVPDAPEVLGGTIELDAVERVPAAVHTDADGEHLEVGSVVEVRSRFQRRWCAGFSVAEVVAGDDRVHYRLIRRSDRELLPVLFDADDLRIVGTGGGSPAEPHLLGS
jgi:hypothetical protein